MPDIYVAKNRVKEQESKRVKKKKVTTQKACPEPNGSEAIAEKVVKAEKKTTNPLAAFIARPKDIRFETQERKEEIVLLLRRHWVTNIRWLLGTGLMVFIPTLYRFFPLLDFLPPRFRFISFLLWYMLTFAFAFEQFLSWFFNVNIITDERIVDIDFPSILYKDITETKIDQIQDISTKVGGFARSLFNFGDVYIQTAGAVPEICFEAIPNPGQVSRILNEMIIQEEKEKLEGRVR